MDTTSTFLLLDVIALACGLYCFYTWIRLLIEKKLFKNGILVPKEKQPEDCLDEEGYIRHVKPRLAILAFVTTIYGALQIVHSNVVELPFMVGARSFIPLGVVLAVLIWYAIDNGKANREYFGL